MRRITEQRRTTMRRYLRDYYVVQPGDTLSGIAASFYGRPGAFRYLAAINGIPNPNFIRVGQVVFLG
jgi:nucleoid-associated protein YgaU